MEMQTTLRFHLTQVRLTVGAELGTLIHTQLMRVQADVTTMKISVEVPHKKKNQLKIDLPHK